MPGLAGFASSKPLSPKQLNAQLEALENALTRTAHHRLYRVLYGPGVGGAAICPSWQSSPIAQTHDGLTLWLDGACFNRAELARKNNRKFASDAEFFLSAITNPLDRALLKSVDGLFSAVVFDAHRNLLHIVTDRYGLRPLYWFRSKDYICWASETKAFLTLPDFSPKIFNNAPEAFLATGQLPAGQTWLSQVEQLPPATRLTCRLKDNSQSRERYWHWQELAPLIDKNSLPDLACELGRRFCAAVKRQSQMPQIGLVLSGGLDSRALLAAMPDGTRTFTFGQENSPDVTIAAQVAGIKEVSHDIWPLDAQNWLCPRIVGNWSLDGALNVLHMHGVEHMHKLADVVWLCFNGAGGDGLAGGGHLFAPNELETYLKNTLHLQLDNHPSVLNAVRETFNRTGSSHAFYIDWRMRGFTIHGPRLCQFAGLDFRIPFLDNTVQEFLFAVPLEFKRHNKLYRHMLLSTFPDYFSTIPYQATGYPISWSNWAIKGAKALKKWQQKTPEKSFASYADWLREPPARSFFETHLSNPKALMFDYLSPEPILSLWQAHLQGENHAEMLGRYVTFEIYLQQLYNKKYRTQQEVEQVFKTL